MSSVILKGRKEGFQIILESSASFETIMEEIEKLKQQLKKDTEAGHELKFHVKTGRRDFSPDEKDRVRRVLEDDFFKIVSFDADVISIEKAEALHQKARPMLQVRTVRSGQILDAEGDLLLVGQVHPGGTVRATGSIYIIGELKGIAHAGFSGDESAIVLADFRYNAQVRIGGNVHLIEKTEEKAEESGEAQFVYVNDLHIIEIAPLHNLKQLRPEIANHSGGLF
ncbi:Septum site-determining protein MinC [Alkalibacterium sp. AK22]|uniref:septum site-determining protein MinC n=1 Tax=Alkalibacterium sp. AK22 TaxID=1229520 RepID=UPI0004473172|nr:septum site-determining protein MinC [Alkalibacterium sp. AK22]EXJ22823.1 Septum site-determining protein MinC [Alkalibacterium sp. AK22]